jgi:hypothetical protein
MAFLEVSPHCYPLCLDIGVIMNRVHRPVMCFLRLNDFVIYYWSQFFPAIEWQLQLSIYWL